MVQLKNVEVEAPLTKKKQPLQHYLTLMRKGGIEPNFYVSIPYLTLCGAKCYQAGEMSWVEANGWMIFPVLSAQGNFVYTTESVWSDFQHYHNPQLISVMLDWEYIFNPVDFKTMTGGKWEVFRKNCRKWPREHDRWLYTLQCSNTQEVQQLLGNWLEAKGDDMEDGETVVRFVLSDIPGIERRYLYERDKLVAVNAWDENEVFINYRVCITNGDAWLTEFVREMFYSDPAMTVRRKLVNDGGTVGNLGLERFKDKMNPLVKRQRFTWTEIL